MCAHHILFAENSGYRFKVIRVSRGLQLPEASDKVGMLETALSRVESRVWTGHIHTYIQILEGYELDWDIIFRIYTTSPARENGKLIDMLARELGGCHRNRDPLIQKINTIAFLRRRCALLNQLLAEIGMPPVNVEGWEERQLKIEFEPQTPKGG